MRLEDLLETLTRGNFAEVKIVLASIALALGIYQVLLMAVGYGKLRLAFLTAGNASRAHRAIGDGILLLVVLVAVTCLTFYGFEEAGESAALTIHAIAGVALLVAFALKIGLVRRWHRLGALLPVVGLSIFSLLIVAWFTVVPEALEGV